jgi:RHS repeat-associated protein
MTDSVGAQIGNTVKYLPFGEARATVTIPTDKLFTGQRLDGTGLYYYNARYYDPLIGRFISADTVIQSMANPQCLNRYSYCLNNPLKYSDPSGHDVVINGVDVRGIYDSEGSPYRESVEFIANMVSSDTFKAYDTIRSIDTAITSVLENSAMTITIFKQDLGATRSHDNAGNLVISTTAAETRIIDNSTVQMIINSNSLLDLSVETLVLNMSHELVHAYGDTLDPYNKVNNSRFEENLCDMYSKQICDKAGIYNSYVAPTYFWTEHTDISFMNTYPMPIPQNGGTFTDAYNYYMKMLYNDFIS